MMKLIFIAAIVGIMDDVILAGDVDVGDVIALPDTDRPVLVTMVRLGQGGLIFTVASPGPDSASPDSASSDSASSDSASSDSASTDSAASDPAGEEERLIKLTAKLRLLKRGRDMGQ